MDLPARVPAHAAPTTRRGGVSRRGLLLSGAAVVLAGGGGVTVGALRPLGQHGPTGRPPAELVAAVAAETALIASIDATTGGSPAVRVALHQIRANHVAHQVALQGAVAGYPQGPPTAAPSSPVAVPALTVAGLRSAERRASALASARAARLIGQNATLLASIAACEATHAELFG